MINTSRKSALAIALLFIVCAWTSNLPSALAAPKKAADKATAKAVHKPATDQPASMGSVDSTMFEAATGGAHRDESVEQIAQSRPAGEEKQTAQSEAPTNVAANLGMLFFCVVLMALVSTCGSAGVCAIAYNIGNAVRGSKPSIG